MKYTDEKLGLVTVTFEYEKEERPNYFVSDETYIVDQTFCTIEIGEERYVGIANRYYKDQPNKYVGRKIAFDYAWKKIKQYSWRKITKEDRTRIWNKLMESGIKLF